MTDHKNRWERRDSKKFSKKNFQNDNRNSVREMYMRAVSKKAGK
jgi:hypothetical protein